MDAAQMLTAPEIVRQCERLAQTVRNSPEPTSTRHLRLADPITQPIPVVEPDDPEPEPPSDSGLSEQDMAIMSFERHWWKRSGAKEQAIRELFDMPVSRYYQLVNALLDKPAAHRADMILVKRLRNARDGRQRARAARQSGLEPQQ